MPACLAFNFLLHIGYGREPFLYRPDWTYAVVLFTAISLGGLIERGLFKGLLFIFVLAVFLNNLWIVYFPARRAGAFLD